VCSALQVRWRPCLPTAHAMRVPFPRSHHTLFQNTSPHPYITHSDVSRHGTSLASQWSRLVISEYGVVALGVEEAIKLCVGRPFLRSSTAKLGSSRQPLASSQLCPAKGGCAPCTPALVLVSNRPGWGHGNDVHLVFVVSCLSFWEMCADLCS
jgi:hypothetical protein